MPVTRIRLSLIPPVGGVVLGTVLALAVAFTPAVALDALVLNSGLSAITEPPVGTVGRLLLAVCLGVGVGAVGWAALYLLFGTGGVFAREGGEDGMPQVRSADRHPDAPPRRPLSAADLSTRADDEGDDGDGPLPIAGPAAPIERPIPVNLDQPLAEFDPRAVPAEPLAPARALPPLATPAPPKPQPLAPGERIDSFELSSRHAAESGAPSVEALLARLEQGTMLHQRRLRAS